MLVLKVYPTHVFYNNKIYRYAFWVKSAKNIYKHLNIKTMKQEQTAKAEKQNMPKVRKSDVDQIFTLVKKDGKIKIAVGNYQISRKEFKDWKEAEKYLESKPYEIIINVACLFATKQNEKK